MGGEGRAGRAGRRGEPKYCFDTRDATRKTTPADGPDADTEL
ncbi:hypothetical protein [Streptomyces phaeolivaceus]|nr:hypothetical protein [Streptomyces phaeolivaceus]